MAEHDEVAEIEAANDAREARKGALKSGHPGESARHAAAKALMLKRQEARRAAKLGPAAGRAAADEKAAQLLARIREIGYDVEDTATLGVVSFNFLDGWDESKLTPAARDIVALYEGRPAGDLGAQSIRPVKKP